MTALWTRAPQVTWLLSGTRALVRSLGTFYGSVWGAAVNETDELPV